MTEAGESYIPKLVRLQFRVLPIVYLVVAVIGILYLQHLKIFLVIYVLLSTYLTILFVKAKMQKYAAANMFLLSGLMLYLIFLVETDLSRMLSWLMLNTGSAFMGFYAYLNSFHRDE